MKVVCMCVHGVGISAMACITRMAWGIVSGWLESAFTYAQEFNRQMRRGFILHEL